MREGSSMKALTAVLAVLALPLYFPVYVLQIMCKQ